ncbi:MAG: DUF1289 domain-containing protein, partial [Rhodobacterales bacterium]|nr:DUF1289 domain-containing protein [Rhodobacterales bacterium]
MTPTSGSSLVSPCTGVCRMDQDSGLCLGCARTSEEIALWRDAPPAFRDAVWDALPARFARLGITCTRLPWDADVIRAEVLKRLSAGDGTWVFGVSGAVAEVMLHPGARFVVTVHGDSVTALTHGGGLRLLLGEDLRALSFATPSVPADRAPLALVVLRERGRLPVASGLADLGPDTAALDPASRSHRLFDLGLGRKEARFCVRCPPGDLSCLLTSLAGADLATVLRVAGPRLVAESPARVVESALGRAEVTTPIPPPGGRSQVGPHTHLLPDVLASGRATPPGIDIPRAYLPGALFHPAPSPHPDSA